MTFRDPVAREVGVSFRLQERVALLGHPVNPRSYPLGKATLALSSVLAPVRVVSITSAAPRWKTAVGLLKLTTTVNQTHG